MSSKALERVIERVKKTYSSWNKQTTINTMRADWDTLFAANISAQTTDFQIANMGCRWIVDQDALQHKVVLYLHGGGFRLGSVNSHQELMARISTISACKVLGINYRLIPEHRFPAALEDAFSAYNWLLQNGYKGENIAIAGDSAGGNLVAALLNLLRDRNVVLPAAVVLLSPWLDMKASAESYQSRAKFDPIHQHKMILALARDYLRDNSDADDPLATPLNADLAGLPPMLIHVGDHEVGLGDATQYAAKAKQAGVEVELEIWDEMIHAFHLFAADLPEAEQAIDKIGLFLRKHLF
ncbi:alpha/beta hydrolase [Paraglaciecola agarilytica]|uniref:alpha/beta hydrolase n=1 Tax=Paraglaciecola chathamensis TaxID=368405 RepID=UPI0023545128|nr:alpha/beta hydrolase [Paraglaciecola agarilytica]|tara:strand:+ start:4543 stop:5433 length:891 start_codon:yes stop_codon:yes gene_type:complete